LEGPKIQDTYLPSFVKKKEDEKENEGEEVCVCVVCSIKKITTLTTWQAEDQVSGPGCTKHFRDPHLNQ
jgi:hypothetical protein